MGIIQPSYAFPEPFYPSSLRAGGKDPDISLPEELPALPLYPIAASVDASDAQTPDNWVKRVCGEMDGHRVERLIKSYRMKT